MTVCADGNDYSDYGNNGTEYDVDFTDFTNVVDGATVFKGSMASYFEVSAADIFDTKFHLTILLHVQASSAGDLLYFEDYGVRLSLVDNAGNYDLQFTLEARDDAMDPVVVTYSNFPGDVWTYVAAVYDYNAAAATIYIDNVAGTPVSFASSSEIKTLGNITVGRNMSGSIHCVRVYDRVLDTAEITASEMCPLGKYIFTHWGLNTLRLRQNGRLFPDDIFKWVFLNGNVCISIKISLKFVPKGLIYNLPLSPPRRQAIIWTNDG